MNKTKGVLAAVVALALGSTVTLSAFAAGGTVTGKAGYSAGDGANSGWVQIVGAGGSFPGCTASAPALTGDRFFRFPENTNGDKMRAVVLAAVLAGKTITVTWDDSFKDESNMCVARAVELH